MQESQNNKFDQQVKNTLENASVEPPAFLWNAIESKLPSSNVWYSKYKYLLLLLLLVFTSASSILVYKHIVLNDVSNIAMNKRMLKDETGLNGQLSKKVNQTVTGENTSTATNGNANNANTTAASENINTKKDVKQPSVASFYPVKTTEKGSGAEKASTPSVNTQPTAAAKRTERLKRLEVKTESQESGTKSQKSGTKSQESGVKNYAAKMNNVNGSTPLIASAKSAKKSFKHIAPKNNELKNNNSLDGNSALAETDKNNKVKTDNSSENNSDNNSTADNSSANSSTQLPIASGTNVATSSSNNSSTDDDVTKPIAEPIRGATEEPLTASVVPIKVQQTAIPSRDVLRSLIAPEKLEKLDIESQAAGINDLNPNREKMLKNLKQFAGYDINKGFYIGAFISINNVWLNKKQFSADENTTSIKPKVQFGKAYGLNIGYDYTDRWGIVLESQISEQGAKYSMTELPDNKKCIKDVNLMYFKLPLMLKYKQVFINNYNSKPIALSFLFGPQVGFLLKKDVRIDGKKLNDVPLYNKTEFGLTGGFDFDLFMTRNMALTIGGRTGFGTSMRKGDPMSFQLGITTQLNFRFPKKIK